MRKVIVSQRGKSTNQQGFSLIELLVSIALLGIVAGIGASIFGIINTSYNQSNALSLMQTQGSQVLEVMERSIRGASEVEIATNGNDGCLNDQCLIITIPPNSIEYRINGGCNQTVYGWTNETTNANGYIARYYLDNFGNVCNDSEPIVLFDGNTVYGVSVQQHDGPVFSVDTGPKGVQSVQISFNLSSGIDVKTDHANVPLTTTVGLRDY